MATLSSTDNQDFAYWGGRIPDITVTPHNLVDASMKMPQQNNKIDFKDVFSKLFNFVGGFSDLISQGWSYREAQKEREWNRQQQIEAEERAMARWKEQFGLINEYNNPVAMAQRYRQAGINPLSAMTNSAGATASSATPSYSASNMPTANMPSNFGNLIEAFASNNLKDAQTEHEKVLTAIAEYERVYQAAIADNRPEQYFKAYDILVQEYENMIKQGENIEALTAQYEQATYLAMLQSVSEALGWELTAAQIDNYVSSTLLQNTQAWQIEQLTPEQRMQLHHSVQLIMSQTENQHIKNSWEGTLLRLESEQREESVKNSRNERMNRTWNSVNMSGNLIMSLINSPISGLAKNAKPLLSNTYTEYFDAKGKVTSSKNVINTYE